MRQGLSTAGRVTALVVLTLALVLEWILTLAFESPMAVVMPVSLVAIILGVVASLASLSIPRGMQRTAPMILAALPMAWLLWQEWGRVACREVEVEGPQATLAGTICVPRPAGLHAGAVFVHGSGPQTRDELLFYAKFLARRGIVAVAYDKRGSGRSGGDTYATGYEGYAADARAFARLVQEHPAVNPQRVGFVGFSEAEWVIPLALADSPAAFAVIIGASGLTPHQQVRESIAIRLHNASFGPADVAAAQAVHENLRDYLLGNLDKPAFAASLHDAQSQPWFSAAAKNLPAEVPQRSEHAWWHSVMDFSPKQAWSHFTGRLLILKGGQDDRSNAQRVPSRIQSMLPASTSADFMTYDHADHNLLQWPFAPRTPPPAWPDGYPDILATWIDGE